MGGKLSSFCKGFLKRFRSKKRDRWVRDEERGLLPPKSTNYGAIPKRIEREVFEGCVPDPPARLPRVRPEVNFHEEIHGRMMEVLNPPDYVLHCAREENQNESEHNVRHQVAPPCPEEGAVGGEPPTRPRRRKTLTSWVDYEEHVAIEKWIAAFRESYIRDLELNQVEEVEVEEEEEEMEAEKEEEEEVEEGVVVPSSHHFDGEMYDLVVYSCDSNAASWMEYCW